MPLGTAMLCMHGISSNKLLILEAMDDVGDNFPTKDEGDRTALILYVVS